MYRPLAGVFRPIHASLDTKSAFRVPWPAFFDVYGATSLLTLTCNPQVIRATSMLSRNFSTHTASLYDWPAFLDSYRTSSMLSRRFSTHTARPRCSSGFLNCFFETIWCCEATNFYGVSFQVFRAVWLKPFLSIIDLISRDLEIFAVPRNESRVQRSRLLFIPHAFRA